MHNLTYPYYNIVYKATQALTPVSCLLCLSHIMEHLEGVIDKPENDMSPQELQLHYFKMHDYDGNNLLDGLELATAISHVHKEVCVCVCWTRMFDKCKLCLFK